MEEERFDIICPKCGTEQSVLTRHKMTTVTCSNCKKFITAFPIGYKGVFGNWRLEGLVGKQLIVMWIAIIIALIPGVVIIFDAPFNYSYFWVLTFVVWMLAGGIIYNMKVVDKARKEKGEEK